MISTTHIVTGAAIGLFIERMALTGWGSGELILLVFVLGVASHHFLDLIPHTDTGSFRDDNEELPMTKGEVKFAWMDNFFGTLLILNVFLFREQSWLMLVGAAGANFPDVWHHPVWWRRFTRKNLFPLYYNFHEFFHWTAKGNLIPLGVLTNLLFIIGGLFYILY